MIPPGTGIVLKGSPFPRRVCRQTSITRFFHPHGKRTDSETATRTIMLPIVWSEVFAFLSVKDVVALLTALRKLLKLEFFLSTVHKSQVLALALRGANTYQRVNMLAGTVEVLRPLTRPALRHFAAFVGVIPAEIMRSDLDWMCDDDWEVTGGSTLTVTHGASGMRLCVPCAVCSGGNDDDDDCGTLVLTRCNACCLTRHECSSCCGTCDSCEENVCRACLLESTTTEEAMCRSCGFLCGGACEELCHFDNGSSFCEGASDTRPCPHNLGIRCDDCREGMDCCTNCGRTTCIACSAVSFCTRCEENYCLTCRPSTACLGCGEAECLICRDDSMVECSTCLEFYCEGCAETMRYCHCCERAYCALCPLSNLASCPSCDDLFCALPTCTGRVCSECDKPVCADCCRPTANEKVPPIDFDALIQRESELLEQMMEQMMERMTMSELLEKMKLLGRTTNAGDERGATDMRMRCLSLLRHMYHDPASTPFWTPGLPTPPRDLGTITAQLTSRVFPDPALFVREVDLVWANFAAYGPREEGSALRDAAVRCKAQVDRLYGAWVEAPDRPEDPDLFACRSCAASMHS